MRKKRIAAKRTKWQMLNNSASGVPLAENASNLELAYSAKGANINSMIWTPDRGNYNIHADKATTNNSAIVGHRVDWQVSGGTSVDTGSWPDISATDDFLFIIAGQHSADGSHAESPTITFRLSTAKDSGPIIKLRAYPTLFGDQLQDDDGNSMGDASGIALSREYTADGTDYIVVGALSRTTNKYHRVGWDGNATLVQDTNSDAVDDTDGVTPLGAFTLSAGNFSTVAGKFYGVGFYRFPSGLPSDWKIASLNMGLAWINGNFTFWPAWGKN